MLIQKLQQTVSYTSECADSSLTKTIVFFIFYFTFAYYLYFNLTLLEMTLFHNTQSSTLAKILCRYQQPPTLAITQSTTI